MRPCTGFGDTAAGKPSRAAVRGAGPRDRGRGRRELRLRPPPPPEGKGRRWPARSEPDAAARAAGAARLRDRAATGSTEPGAGAGAPPTRSRARPLLSRTPPPRAALSIHKFSAGSAATELQSQPGAPCIRRPPSCRPWAARPGAEVGAAGPGAAGPGGDGRANARGQGMATSPRARPGPPVLRARARGSGEGAAGAWERPEAPCTPPTVRSPERARARAGPRPQFTRVTRRGQCRLGLLDAHEPGIGFPALSRTLSRGGGVLRGALV